MSFAVGAFQTEDDHVQRDGGAEAEQAAVRVPAAEAPAPAVPAPRRGAAQPHQHCPHLLPGDVQWRRVHPLHPHHPPTLHLRLLLLQQDRPGQLQVRDRPDGRHHGAQLAADVPRADGAQPRRQRLRLPGPLLPGGAGAGEHAGGDQVHRVLATAPRRQGQNCPGAVPRGLEHHQEPLL